jgi:hypothetical protein
VACSAFQTCSQPLSSTVRVVWPVFLPTPWPELRWALGSCCRPTSCRSRSLLLPLWSRLVVAELVLTSLRLAEAENGVPPPSRATLRHGHRRACAGEPLAPSSTPLGVHCRGECIGGDLVTGNLVDDELSPVNSQLCSVWLTHGVSLTMGPAHQWIWGAAAGCT